MKKSQLMTINQLAKICSTSRASLLRMEKDGILHPIYLHPENGYRYYDDSSVMTVNMNLSLHEAGISHKELREYYNNEHSSAELLQKLESRLQTLEYHIANLRLQLKNPSCMNILPFTFPAVDCYTKQVSQVKDSAELSGLIQETLHEVVEKGYRINRNVSLFEVFDYEKQTMNALQNSGYEYTICIPVFSGRGDSNLVHFPSTEMLSKKLFGGASDIVDAIGSIKEYASENQILLDNTIHVIGVVNSFSTPHPTGNAWVTQVCIPVLPLSEG